MAGSNTLGQRIARNWELYLFILPAFGLIVLFHYVPVYGLQLAFKRFLAVKGIWGSPWTGLQNLRIFFNSASFELIVFNTLSISLYELIAGFPMPVILALIFHYTPLPGVKKTVQMVSYAPHFITVVVLVGMLGIMLHPVYGPINLILKALGFESVFFMIKPELFLGTAINLAVMVPAAYALSRKDLVGRNLIMAVFVFTMFFGGGLIPTYLLVRNLGLYDTIWPMVLLPAVSVYLMIIARTFFQTTIPDELLAAAQIDGCTNRQFFLLVVIPVSPAIIAVLTLFCGVNHWNQFFLPLIYLERESLRPLQLVLRDLLTQVEWLASELGGDESFLEQQKMADLMKYGVIIVASVPMLVLYPFIQRHFVQGVMIGSLKG